MPEEIKIDEGRFAIEVDFDNKSISLKKEDKPYLDCSFDESYRVYKLLQGVLKELVTNSKKPKDAKGNPITLSNLNV